jgi:hypothetical protein
MFWFEEQNRRQRDRHMDRIIAWLVPVSQQKHVSQSVTLSVCLTVTLIAGFAQAGQAEEHLGQPSVPTFCLERFAAT